MPTLKQLTCNVEWSASGPSLPLQEYGTAYFDGLVETYIAIPPISTPFSIRLQSDGYIAPGLSMFVYIDGEYQCNRGRNNLKVPSSIAPKHHTNVEFIVRQKEESLSDGQFLGRQWIFGKLDGASDAIDPKSGLSHPRIGNTGVIEVVVLRSLELQRPKAPNPSVSELHPIAFRRPFGTCSTSLEGSGTPEPPEDTEMTDFSGLFDGASDFDINHSSATPFGGDMAWDDEGRDHGAYTSKERGGAASQPRGISDCRSNRSHVPSRSSSVPAATPAIIINVNQPAGSGSAQWPGEPQQWHASPTPAAESQQWRASPASAAKRPKWRRPPGSVADSWVTHEESYRDQAAQDQHNRSDNDWQTWIKEAEKKLSETPGSNRGRSQASNHQNSPQHSSSSNNGGGWDSNDSNRWGKAADRSTNNQSQNMAGAWGTNTQNEQYRSDINGWNGHGGTSGWNDNTDQDTSGQNNNNGWDYNHNNNNHQQDTGWDDGKNGGDDQGNWDSNAQNNNPNDDWGGGNGGGNKYDNNRGNGDWDQGQNDKATQGGYGGSGGQNEGGWNADQGNMQGDNGWNDTGHGDSNNNQCYNNYNDNRNDSGDTWDNANAGAKEYQTSVGPSWYTSAPDQNNWNQEGGANDAFPATIGASDLLKTRSRRPSFGHNKSVRANLSRKATMNSAAQKMGWNASNSVRGNGAGSVHSGQKQSGPPGAWPENAQNDPSRGIKPYHVVIDAVGNPRLPATQQSPPIIEAPAPAPPAPVHMPHQVQQGNPALYHHKTASPRYIDTHDKPYASFIFEYRPKAVIEQMLNLNIPDGDDVEKAKLAHLSKEELIEQVIKTKSQLGSKASSAVSGLSTVPPSITNFAKGGNGNWGASQNGRGTSQKNENNGWNSGNGGNQDTGNAGPGPSGGAFSMALSDKLAALAGRNNNSSNSSSGSKNNQGWNNAPPGSTLANNGNANFGGLPKWHAPSPPVWGGPNNDNWNGQPAATPDNGCDGGGGGGNIGAWLSKTPVGASVRGHKPWNGNSNASVKFGSGSVQGGKRGKKNSNWGGSQANNGNGAWNGFNAGNNNGNWRDSQMNNNGNGGNGSWGGGQNAETATQKNSPQESWNGNRNDGGGEGGGWNDTGGNGNGGKQTNSQNRGNGNSHGGRGWNDGGNGNGWSGGNEQGGHGGDQTGDWNGGNGKDNGNNAGWDNGGSGTSDW
ncbi:MAG: hypothetical protein Q9166_001749 [cf. Caloplaca sp. 2 TL-2023]